MNNVENEPFKIVHNENYSNLVFTYEFSREKKIVNVTCHRLWNNIFQLQIATSMDDNRYIKTPNGWHHISKSNFYHGFGRYTGVNTSLSKERLALLISKDVSSFLSIPCRFKNDLKSPDDIRNHPVWKEMIDKAEDYYNVISVMEM